MSKVQDETNQWVCFSDEQTHPGEDVGVMDITGEPNYVARAFYNSDLIAGKLLASELCTYISGGGLKFQTNSYNIISVNTTSSCSAVFNSTALIDTIDTDRNAVEPVWVEGTNGDAPPGYLVGGHDINGEPIYVARAECREDLAPGKLIASKRCTFVTWKGEELQRYSYEVLVGCTNIWVPVSGSNIPTKAYAGGYTRSGEPLYVGRVHHKGSITTGKVQQSHGLCYIAFDGHEFSFSDYEVLTY